MFLSSFTLAPFVIIINIFLKGGRGGGGWVIGGYQILKNEIEFLVPVMTQ